jgi:D-glycerate 3-kinase
MPQSNQHFLDYPSYELFVNPLRDGIFKSTQASEQDWKGRQLRLIVDVDRKVQEAILI